MLAENRDNANPLSPPALTLSGYVYPAQSDQAESDRPKSTRRRSAMYFGALALVAIAVAVTQPAVFTIGMLVVLLIPAALLNKQMADDEMTFDALGIRSPAWVRAIDIHWDQIDSVTWSQVNDRDGTPWMAFVVLRAGRTKLKFPVSPQVRREFYQALMAHAPQGVWEGVEPNGVLAFFDEVDAAE